MCMFPIALKRVQQSMKMSNQGTIIQNVPCGKCVECVKAKINSWLFRLDKEVEISSSVRFITLTYSTDNLTYADDGATLVKRDVQLFMKKLRKAHSKVHKRPLKYFFVGEYGKHGFRPHYHAIIFNLQDDKLIDSSWNLGFVSVSPLRSVSGIKYMFKYMSKPKSGLTGRQREFSLMSKGMGASFLTDAMHAYYHPELELEQRTYVTTKDGFKIPIPKYYKEKLFNDDERRILSNYLEARVPLVLAEQIKQHTYKYYKKTVNEVLNSLQLSKQSKTFTQQSNEVL